MDFFFLTGNIFLTGNGGFISHRVAAARRSPRWNYHHWELAGHSPHWTFS